MKKPRRYRTRKIKPRVIRCFIGIQFPLVSQIDPLRKSIARLAESSLEAGSNDTPVRLVPDENLHITLKFIGSVEERKLAAIEGVMKQVAAQHKPISLQSQGMGFFKSSIWIGVNDNPQLAQLAADLNLACVPLGVAQEEKAYLPHVTVARLGKGAKLLLSQLLDTYSEQAWGEMQASAISLYRSDTLPEGARYTEISTARLMAD